MVLGENNMEMGKEWRRHINLGFLIWFIDGHGFF